MPSAFPDLSSTAAAAPLSPLFWSDRQVAQRLGCGRASVWRAVRDGDDFPKPVRLLGRRVGWRVSEVEAWAAGRESR